MIRLPQLSTLFPYTTLFRSLWDASESLQDRENLQFDSTMTTLRILAGAVLHEVRKDRKSTRLNSSHVAISYAVFCLKKKNNGIGRILRMNLLQSVSIAYVES